MTVLYIGADLAEWGGKPLLPCLHSQRIPAIPGIDVQPVISLLRAHVRNQPQAPAILTVDQGQTRTRTWGEVADAVSRYAHALSTAGVQPGDRVVQWSPNRAEWILTDLAIASLQAIHVPIHATLSGAQAVAQILHSGSGVVILGGSDQWSQLSSYLRQLPEGTVLFSHDRIRRWTGCAVRSLADAAADADAEEGIGLIDKAIHDCDPDSIATILYTSGTTGNPKGIVLSHRNLMTNAQAVVDSFGEQPLEIKLCFLPLSHIFGRTCDIYTWMVRGSQLALAQSRETIIDDCKRFSPTLINGVPYFFERVHQKLVEKGVANQPGSLQRVLGGGHSWMLQRRRSTLRCNLRFLCQSRHPLVAGVRTDRIVAGDFVQSAR